MLAVAVVVYAFTLFVVAPLYARNVEVLPGFVNNFIDALISTGLIFNFVFLLLTLTRWLEGTRAVRAALVVTTLVVGALITLMVASLGAPARLNPWVVVAQVFSLLFWFTVHLLWVLRRRSAGPPASAA
jgi:hypothetical protein